MTDAPADTPSPTPLSVTIQNQRGLHARASAKFVQLAESFNADISVSKDGESAMATSIMGLMMLGASLGSKISLSGDGPDASEAMAALIALVEAKFDEE
jgi:phosphocarrier protein